MRVFVTGGNGFIGSVVVRELLAAGHEVTCLLRPGSRTQRIDQLIISRLTGNICEAASVRSGMKLCNATVHLAGLSSWKDINSRALKDVVEGGTKNVLEAAADLPGHRVVFISSTTAVNGSDQPEIFDESSIFTLKDPDLRYAHAKFRAESLCRSAFQRGVNVVIVNPAEVYGPFDTELVTAGNLVELAASKLVPLCTGGTSVVYVDDVAAGILAALEKGRPGERYILGGDNLTIAELASLFLELVGRRSKIILLPNGVIRRLSRVATGLGISLPFNAHVIPYATRFWFMDNSKARRELEVSFRGPRDTLIPTISWLRQAGYLS